ncbi:hypothetical protein GGS23DRAFT_604454 [Durotheca rogersii]|uniref:uncharacterized protein n=1 Tax=Durotheca rogersii TaxID=419775 RepID=UPI0022206D24|nr:uncharacterized protein GGS23DRAFT_604454 [Durotheca rogersii]KAI5864090.1 hypothetical protein GGS23DRAFT_604454 [Durotheca rogersii]
MQADEPASLEEALSLLSQLRRERAEERERVERERAEERKRVERERAEERKQVERERALHALEQEQLRQDVLAVKQAFLARQREFEQKDQEREQEDRKQTLEEYLAQTSNSALNLPRLLPSKPSQSLDSKTKRATTGRTNIHGKYYPLRLCHWSDFLELHQQNFSRLRDVLSQQRLLPSLREVSLFETRTREKLSQQFRESNAFFNEKRTSLFLDETLQIPAGKIVNAYLNTTSDPRTIFFDDRAAGYNASDSSENNSQSAVNRMTQPDCVVLAAAAQQSPENALDGQGQGEDNDALPGMLVSRVTIGEHKPTHKLRQADVSKILSSLPEDYIHQLAQRRQNAAPDPSIEAPVSVEDLSIGSSTPPTTSSAKSIRNQVYLAYALAQTYHYMIVSGLEFGYLASGEILILLRIPQEDCSTLLYHATLLPEYAQGESQGSMDANTANEDALRGLAVSKLCSLCVLALSDQDTPRSVRWRTTAVATLPIFPRPRASGNATPSETSRQRSTSTSSRSSHQDPGSSLGRRRRDDDDEGDDRGRNTRSRLPPLAHASRMSSPLKHSEVSTPHEPRETGGGSKKSMQPDFRPYDTKSLLPIRPYCTQACLHGLAFGEELDYNCPNILLHEHAACQLHNQPSNLHPITREVLSELVRLQLERDPELDCECYVDCGLSGAIGYLFKITLTCYGYTFVAKGVQSFHSHKLARETAIYERLADVQGSLIPVHLGLIELIVPYPMVNFCLVTHMMLMSYAGLPLYSTKLHKRSKRLGWDIDWDREADRTLRELEGHGLEDDDDNESNLAWDENVRRVIKIDFDQARVPLTKRSFGSDRCVNGDDIYLRPRKRPRRREGAVSVEGLLLS